MTTMAVRRSDEAEEAVEGVGAVGHFGGGCVLGGSWEH